MQSGVSGTVTFDKAVIGETTMTSVGTPPALSGSGAILVVAGDSLRLACTMTRNNQHWSTTALQPLTGQPAAHRRQLRAPPPTARQDQSLQSRAAESDVGRCAGPAGGQRTRLR